MIPKKIHYCWFGRGEKPKLAERCIASWKQFCPDYEIIEWNEDTFDVTVLPYVKEAYEAKKYAFVTDYVRLFAMVTQGGIYMDTDVEVLRSLDEFLVHQAFSGFEDPESIPTGIMACEPGFPLFDTFLHYYDDKHFIGSDGSMHMVTNVTIMTELLEAKGLVKDGTLQTVEGFTLYPQDYFCPLDNATGKLHKSKNTATIHWFSKSWVPAKERNRLHITRLIRRIFGKNSLAWLRRSKGE